MKSRRVQDIDRKVAEFGNAAADMTGDKAQTAVFRRYTFSLTEDVSDDIDELAIVTKRISRSDVIKAGIEAFKQLSKEQQIELLQQIKQVS